MLHNATRYEKYEGGGGSGKSTFVAQKVLFQKLLSKQKRRILLVRKTSKSIRESQFAELEGLIEDYKLRDLFDITKSYMQIRSRVNACNDIITFGMDDAEKIKSIKGITDVWIEEATEITKEDFLQLDLRVRGREAIIRQLMLSYNPINELHWLNKLKLEDCTTLRTTYKDNRFVDENYRRMLERLKDIDPNYYRIYGLGEWGVLENLIFNPFEIRNNYPTDFDEIFYGVDFGFVNPSVVLEIGKKDGVYYVTELLYKKGLTNSQLIKKMQELNVRPECDIFCDSAEPDRIEEFIDNGFYATKPAQKSVLDGIDCLKSNKIISRDENEMLNKEVRMYVYRKDKDGNLIEQPLKMNDHTLDALRYAIYSHTKQNDEIKMAFIN